VATDADGKVIVGDQDGKLRVFGDVGKKAIKCTKGYGDPITDIKISQLGDVLSTADEYFVYYPAFIRKESVPEFIGQVSPKILAHLKLADEPIRNAQFSTDGKTIIFSIGKYLFHQTIQDLITNEERFTVYEAGKPIIFHKFANGQFALVDKPVQFVL
jgi:hypothetical protein